MQDGSRTKAELLMELKELRENVAELGESKLQLVQAEEEMGESEKLNRLILSSISDAVFITDNTGVFTFICPNVNVIFGYSFQEVEKMGKISKLLGAEDLFTLTELERLGEIRNIERDITDKAGKVHYLLVNVKKVSIDKGRCLYSCRDVTERKTAEDTLKKAHEELELKVTERTSELNEANLRLIEEIEGHKSAEEALRESELKLRLKLDSVFSPGVDLVDEELSNIIDAPTIQSFMDIFTELTGMPTAIKDKRGNVLTATGWQDICAKFHRVNPDTKQVCIQTDEEDIRTAENLKPGEYRAYKCDNGLYDVFTPLFIADKLVGNIYTGQILFDDEEVDESFYAERADKYGFNQKEYLEALRRVPRVSRDKVEKTMKYLAKLTEYISRISYSNLILVKTISEKEITEKELRKIQSELNDIIGGSPIPQFIIDQNHMVVHWNSALEEYSRIKAEEIIGTKKHWKAFYAYERPCLADLVVERDISHIDEWYHGKYSRSKLIEGAYEGTDYFPDMLGGKWLYFTAAHIEDNEGNIIGAVETLNDITEQKEAEKELKQSEEKYRSVIENIQDVVYRSDAQNNLIMASPSIIDLLGYNSLDECLGKPIDETFYFNQEDRGEFLKQLHEKGSVTNFEVILKSKDDSPVIVETNSHFYFDEEGSFAGVEGVFRDITERKIAEEGIKKSIKEKENLLTEIHHRVKNNMQIISSLLNLQIQHVHGVETKNVLMESQGRVKTMAMIHEKLYLSSSLTNINIREYIKKLAYDILLSYGIKKGTIKLELNIDDIKMNMETAIPCGLIINELVTNSIKYAFPQQEGTIKIELKSLDNQLKLIVSDNGIGIPENIDIEKTETLGLQLVNSLIGQLEGDIELDISKGTEFKIDFKELEYKKRL